MVVAPQKYAFLNGPIDIAVRDAMGVETGNLFTGNCSDFTLSTAVQTDELRESYTGQNSLAAQVTTQKDLTFKMTLSNLSPQQLQRFLQGSSVDYPSGTTTDEAVGDLMLGQPFHAANMNLSTATLKESSATLVAGTDYSIDLRTGRGVALRVITGATLSTEYGAYTAVGIFAADDQNYVLRYFGINKIDGKPYNVTLYNVRITPASSIGLISTKIASYDISGSCLVDDFRSGAVLGQFGDIRAVL